MNSWCVYIARDLNDLIVGVCDDIIAEESLLNHEQDWKTDYKIVWFLDCKTKKDAFVKFKEISSLDDFQKIELIASSQKLIIVADDNEIDSVKFPLIKNLRYTLSLVDLLNTFPELWKLNDIYIESVAEYLDIKRSQVINAKLWDICIDSSKNVGLITRDKFYPIIKY